jgi:hypothetical protein
MALIFGKLTDNTIVAMYLTEFQEDHVFMKEYPSNEYTAYPNTDYDHVKFDESTNLALVSDLIDRTADFTIVDSTLYDNGVEVTINPGNSYWDLRQRVREGGALTKLLQSDPTLTDAERSDIILYMFIHMVRSGTLYYRPELLPN